MFEVERLKSGFSHSQCMSNDNGPLRVINYPFLLSKLDNHGKQIKMQLVHFSVIDS